MTLHKKDGMWISDWSNKTDPYDDQGCRKRQREQVKKAKALVAKMKTQGWKKLTSKKANEIMNTHMASIEKARESHNKDIKKKWGQKKVKMWKTKNASRYFLIYDWIWDTDMHLEAFSWCELGGYSALLNKGNEYRLIFTNGSDDDEAGYWSKPVTQLAFKSTAAKSAAKKPKAKPRAKAPARKPKAKAKAKPKIKYVRGKKDRSTDVGKRKSPPYSAKQFPKGARKKGNDGKMWTIVTDKRGVKRWKA